MKSSKEIFPLAQRKFRANWLTLAEPALNAAEEEVAALKKQIVKLKRLSKLPTTPELIEEHDEEYVIAPKEEDDTNTSGIDGSQPDIGKSSGCTTPSE